MSLLHISVFLAPNRLLDTHEMFSNYLLYKLRQVKLTLKLSALKITVIIYYLSEFLSQEFGCGLGEWIGCRRCWTWGVSYQVPVMTSARLQLSESLPKAGGYTSTVDLSHGWKVCAGCGQVVSVPPCRTILQGYLDILTT